MKFQDYSMIGRRTGAPKAGKPEGGSDGAGGRRAGGWGGAAGARGSRGGQIGVNWGKLRWIKVGRTRRGLSGGEGGAGGGLSALGRVGANYSRGMWPRAVDFRAVGARGELKPPGRRGVPRRFKVIQGKSRLGAFGGGAPAARGSRVGQVGGIGVN